MKWCKLSMLHWGSLWMSKPSRCVLKCHIEEHSFQSHPFTNNTGTLHHFNNQGQTLVVMGNHLNHYDLSDCSREQTWSTGSRKKNFNKINQHVLFFWCQHLPLPKKVSIFPILLLPPFICSNLQGRRESQDSSKNATNKSKRYPKTHLMRNVPPLCLQVALTAPIFWHHSFAFVA